MSDNDYFHEKDTTVVLRNWALGHMMRGAFLAGLFLLFFWVIYLVISGIGMFLPEESKQAPSPYGALEPAFAQDISTV